MFWGAFAIALGIVVKILFVREGKKIGTESPTRQGNARIIK
jgi:hypothetical protein